MTVVSSDARRERASNHTNFVVEQTGRAIVAGEYPPETMIPLDPDLCEMFGVSRTVVREAKKTLAGKGLIQSKAKVGTHVRRPDDWNMFDEETSTCFATRALQSWRTRSISCGRCGSP